MHSKNWKKHSENWIVDIWIILIKGIFFKCVTKFVTEKIVAFNNKHYK